MKQEELIEQLAEKEHASWAHWMSFVCHMYVEREDGTVIIPGDVAKRWEKRSETPYDELSDQEKQHNRDKVAHILPIIDRYTDEKLKNAVVKTIGRGGLVNPIGKNHLAR